MWSLFSKGISTESIPIKALPLRINGKIELSKEDPPTKPLHAIAPLGLNEVNNRLKTQIFLKFELLASLKDSELLGIDEKD